MMSRLLNGILSNRWVLWLLFVLVYLAEMRFLATQEKTDEYIYDSFIYFSIGSYLALVFFFSDLIFRRLFKNLIIVKILVTLVMVAQLLFNTFIDVNNESFFYSRDLVYGWYDVGFTFSVFSLLFLFLFVTLILILLTYWHKLLGKHYNAITGKKNAYSVFIEYLVRNVNLHYLWSLFLCGSLYELASMLPLSNLLLLVVGYGWLFFPITIIFWVLFFYYLTVCIKLSTSATGTDYSLFSSESEFVRKYYGKYLKLVLPVLVIYAIYAWLIIKFFDYNTFYRLYFFIPAVLYFVMAVLVDRAAFIRLWRGRGDVKLDTVVSENP